MTKNQKILVGLGIGVLVVYVYTRMGKKSQTETAQAQPQDNKGQNLPTSIEKPQVSNKPIINDTRVVDEGKNPIRKDPYGMPIVNYKWDPEAEDLNFAKLKKYGAKFNLAKEGDRLTTKYGTYEYRRKPTGGALGKGFTTTWEKI
jgi:hypothetical protein